VTDVERKDAVRIIEHQLEDDYCDIGGFGDVDEIGVLQEAIKLYKEKYNIVTEA
jgi:hypothetical protein